MGFLKRVVFLMHPAVITKSKARNPDGWVEGLVGIRAQLLHLIRTVYAPNAIYHRRGLLKPHLMGRPDSQKHSDSENELDNRRLRTS